MPRPTTLQDRDRFNISFERALKVAAAQRAKELGLRGGFSEYLARLCVADLRNKGSVAVKVSRSLPRKRGTK